MQANQRFFFSYMCDRSVPVEYRGLGNERAGDQKQQENQSPGNDRQHAFRDLHRSHIRRPSSRLRLELSLEWSRFGNTCEPLNSAATRQQTNHAVLFHALIGKFFTMMMIVVSRICHVGSNILCSHLLYAPPPIATNLASHANLCKAKQPRRTRICSSTSHNALTEGTGKLGNRRSIRVFFLQK